MRVFLIVLLVMLLVVPMVGAQETGDMVTVSEVNASIADILANIKGLLSAISGSAIVGVGTLALTAIFKKIPPLNGYAKYIAGIFSAIIAAVLVAANHFGFAPQAVTTLNTLNQIAGLILLWVGGLTAGAVSYNVARNVKAPIIGDKNPDRSPAGQ